MAEIPIKKGLFHKPEKQGEAPYLIGARCSICGYTSFPRKIVCPRCRRDDCMEEIELGERAKLETFAVMQVGTRDFPPPYIVAYVRTKEGVSIFTIVTDCEAREDALEIGEEMELVIEKIKEDESGNCLLGWKYKPVRVRRKS